MAEQTNNYCSCYLLQRPSSSLKPQETLTHSLVRMPYIPHSNCLWTSLIHILWGLWLHLVGGVLMCIYAIKFVYFLLLISYIILIIRPSERTLRVEKLLPHLYSYICPQSISNLICINLVHLPLQSGSSSYILYLCVWLHPPTNSAKNNGVFSSFIIHS